MYKGERKNDAVYFGQARFASGAEVLQELSFNVPKGIHVLSLMHPPAYLFCARVLILPIRLLARIIFFYINVIVLIDMFAERKNLILTAVHPQLKPTNFHYPLQLDLNNGSELFLAVLTKLACNRYEM
jgi:hypothetical protein